MTDPRSLEGYITRIEAELRENILPFWMANSLDEVRGGFYGEVSNDLTVDRDASKGALLTARILWTFAAAYRRYREAAHLAMARRAYTTLLATFWDPVHGGLYWRVAADGAPLATHKQIYGQAFGIYALAEYSAMTGAWEPLEKALTLFRAIEAHSHDPEHGGYLEALTRAWEPKADMRLSDEDMNVKKSMNTHLHVLEAYTNLLRIWDDPTLRQRLAGLLDVMLHHIIDPATGHMGLFFNEDWMPKSDHVSYGHDIEASWLLVEAAEVLGDPQRLAQAQDIAVRMAQAVYEEGRDDDGAVLYEAGPEGIINAEKQWWPQAEAAVGFLNAYQLSGHAHFLKATLEAWDFIERYLVDREHGGWFRYVTRDHALGTEDAAKISFWKCPYHNARACMELIDRLREVM